MKQLTDIPPARVAALDALRDVLAGDGLGTDVQAGLDSVLKASGLDGRDIGLTTEIVYGYLRLKGRIEAILSRFLKAPEKLPEELHLILGVAAYEILFLDRVPTYASVNWAVDAVRTLISPNLAGLTNAVLRRTGDLGNEVHEKSFYGQPDVPATLARFYSCPVWIVSLWLEHFGPERTEHYLRAQVSPPALGMTVPMEHPEHDRIVVELARHPGLIEQSGPGFAFPAGTQLASFSGDLTLKSGSFAARQALMAMEPETWGEPIWDACCGRGGKTRVLLELGMRVVSSDVHRGRIRALQAELPGADAHEASVFDGAPMEAVPETILLDAPCSGLGVLSRRPDTKWRRREADLPELVALQAQMLDAAAANLAPGGRIVYLTCTLNRDENEGQVQAFLQRNSAFSLESEWTTSPASPLKEFFYGVRLKGAV
ncbi:MAG: antitermination protein NusB [Proteobacteria bacterium]|nr:antitermination protein NusB [Pseudomonadota bacterium]